MRTPEATPDFIITPPCSITETDRVVAEEAVYRWLLFDLDSNTSLIVLEQSRALDKYDRLTADSWSWVSRSMDLLPTDVFADFLGANQDPPDVPSDMSLLTPYYLIRTNEWGEPEAGWAVFHTRFRSASRVFFISRVGFNCTLDRALVYVGKAKPGSADLLPGWRSILYLLTLSNGQWQIDQWTFVSMS